jgi:hypothetical protein
VARKRKVGQFVVKLGFFLAFGGLWIGCDEKEKPRTRDVVFREIQSLPTLYMTGKTRKEVIAPGNKGSFVDEKTGEICWRVMECGNPDCPGRPADAKPLKFITPNPAMYVKPDGTIDYDQKKSKEEEKMAGGACPECLKKRNLKTESNADRNKYAKWVKPHVLPESAKRKEELEAELAATSD